LEELDSQISKAKLYDAGTGIITGDPEEPLYGRSLSLSSARALAHSLSLYALAKMS